ncbi:histidinol-phosphate transaminase [Akkermansia sp.]|uniref:histidinol-phosphate transaminase n=1 Tax=Akkermansia sp. TaxID=1872421 RepID=UPI0025BA9B1F|nr:histidinol-phosphate transaminase [Akkermansia sp.]
MSIESFANQHVLELVAYQPGKPIEETARELGLDPHDIVKLASNENPLGPSPRAVEAVARAAAGVNIYPDGAAFRLRSAIAEFCGVEFDQTVVGTGSSEVIELMCHALLNPQAEVVAARHAFSMYPVMSQLFGSTYVEVPNKPDWTHDLNGFLDAVTDRTRIIFITNPTNPVGTVVTQQEIDEFMDKVPEHVLVCFDEAYREFSDNPPDTLKFVREGRNVIVLRTFSKAYGLAGLRVGYGVAPEHVTGMLHKARAPFNLHVLAQEAALAALADAEHVRRTVENNAAGMRFYEDAFREMGLEWIPSQGNFILVKVGQGRKVFNDMLARGVIVRAQDGYGLPEWIRISIGTPAENARCLEVLREVL